MHYDKYELEDFLLDEKFRTWVLEPTPELNHFWERWLRDNPQKTELAQSARAMVIATSAGVAPLSRERKAKLWTQIRDGRELSTDPQDDPVSMYRIDDSEYGRRAMRLELGFIVKIAAGILFLATVGFLSYTNINTTQELSGAQRMVVKSNPPGQKSKIFLPDGSVLHLNAGSSIVYPATFAANERRIQLRGEAYFQVVRDSLRPFFVETDRLVTAVLGTSFTVSAYPESDAAYVALVSGKVQVVAREAAENPVILQPGEIAKLNTRKKELQKTTADMSDIIAWKDGVMIFDNTSIDRVFARLEQWYGVEITVEGLPVKRMAISTTFDNVTLDNVLNNIGFTAGFTYHIQDKHVTITFK
jgi:ferric-dicitrate binding protein FerR (iron transport regulator)